MIEHCAACGEPGHRSGYELASLSPAAGQVCINALRARAEKAERERKEAVMYAGKTLVNHLEHHQELDAVEAERVSLLRVLEAAREIGPALKRTGHGGYTLVPVERLRFVEDAIAEHDRKDAG